MNEEISKLFSMYINVLMDFLRKEWERGFIQPVQQLNEMQTLGVGQEVESQTQP